MRILALVPSDMTVEATLAGLEHLPGHETIVYRFDRHDIPVDAGMINAAMKHGPDLIVYIGQNGGYWLASESTFLRLKEICPTALLCFDASDKTWTPLLTSYRDHEAFSVVVDIDGCDEWPKRPYDLTLLTPIHKGFYE